MADPRSSEFLFYATPGGGARTAAMLLLFLYGVGIYPELEDMRGKWLAALALSASAFLVLTLAGSAWVFDVSNRHQARERVETLGSWAAAALGVMFASFFGTEGVASLGTLGGLAGYWLCWCDWPWSWIDAIGSALRRVPGIRDYALSATQASPPPKEVKNPVRLPPGAEAILIDSGAFKMDRNRTLEKLSEYQLENPEQFLLPWLRLAVASGATRIDLDRDGAELLMRFDGRPLAPAWTADPFGSLFEEDDADAARHRHLAYGLLALFRLGPVLIEARSGSGPGRAELTVRPKGGLAADGPEPGGSGTTIRVRLGFFTGRLTALRALVAARDEFCLAQTRLFIQGKEIPPEWTLFGPKAVEFESGSTRAVFAPPVPGQEGKILGFYCLGAFVSHERDWGKGPSFIAWVRDDRLSLNISQSGVVRNKVYKEVLDAVIKEGNRVISQGDFSADPGAHAYTKAGLFSALTGASAAWAGLLWALERRPDLAFPALAAYGAVTAAMLGLLAKWFRARLAGKANPFRPQA